MESCGSDELDCYVIDGNGYVIISEDNEHTGIFFGEMEGAIMESMVLKNIFRKIRIFDYQAMCYKHINTTSSGSFMSNVSKFMFNFYIFFILIIKSYFCTGSKKFRAPETGYQ